MAATDTGIALTPGELVAFTGKLDAWAQTLTPRERAFLEQLLADARDAAAEGASGYADVESALEADDVQGFAFFGQSPFAGLVAGYREGLAQAEAEAEQFAAFSR
jgi:hypothetical protein